MSERESMPYDVVIVGAGPAGLTAAIRLKQLAAERGGNCEVTRPGETISHQGVTVIGPLNLPSTVAFHASQLYAKNIATFLLHLAKEGKIRVDRDDASTTSRKEQW